MRKRFVDLDGDRKLDLVSSTDRGTFSVLLNKRVVCDVQEPRPQTLVQARQTLARVNCRVGKDQPRVFADDPWPHHVVVSRGGKPS